MFNFGLFCVRSFFDETKIIYIMMKKTTLFLCAMFFSLLSVYAQKINVATFNIRYDNRDDAKNGNGWKQRSPVVRDLIRFHEFEIFGLQEVLKNQLADLLKAMPEFDYIGVGRDDGKLKGELAPIFYNKSIFNMLDNGSFWLSEKTDRPNKGWDAALPRICTWGKFELRSGSKSFWLFNLHMDHVGVVARQESAKLVLDRILSMCDGEPVVLMGDFNVDQFNEAYQLLNTSGILKDAYDVAAIRYALNGTFNAFDPNLVTEKRIDHIFVSDHFRVTRYGVLTDTYRADAKNKQAFSSANFPVEATLVKSEARLPSDHFPVLITLVFNNE